MCCCRVLTGGARGSCTAALGNGGNGSGLTDCLPGCLPLLAGWAWGVLQVVAQHPDMPGADVAAMYAALLAFCGTGAALYLL